jgi:hypothetical protein
LSTRRKAVVFGVFSKSKIFRHTSFSLSLWLLFLKKTNSEEEEEEEEKKEGKKASNFQSCRLSFYTHTRTKNAQRRRSKTERRESCALK